MRKRARKIKVRKGRKSKKRREKVKDEEKREKEKQADEEKLAEEKSVTRVQRRVLRTWIGGSEGEDPLPGQPGHRSDPFRLLFFSEGEENASRGESGRVKGKRTRKKRILGRKRREEGRTQEAEKKSSCFSWQVRREPEGTKAAVNENDIFNLSSELKEVYNETVTSSGAKERRSVFKEKPNDL
ncbi:hypothetical protein ANN_08333 [Periplaneta americana]|uniref:Uncharacterized protein n=1 Tax=Periplaneta americana TaxID=6978 RepID=A0ABQ8T2P4_PERAM|nr:hypothetical protein ANN_08333 [Periplaneta americana]